MEENMDFDPQGRPAPEMGGGETPWSHLEPVEVRRRCRREFNLIGGAFFVFMLLNLVLSTVIVGIARQNPQPWMYTTWFVVAVNTVSLYALGLPVLCLILRGCESWDLPGRKAQTISPMGFVRLMLVSFSTVYLGNLLSLALTGAISRVKGSPVENPLIQQLVSDTEGPEQLIPLFIYLVVLAPLLEEYVFRGLLLDRLRKYGDGFCMVVVGFVFALFHANLSQMIYAFTTGVIFAYVVLRTGTLLYSILLHTLINFMGFLSFYALLMPEEQAVNLTLAMGNFVLFSIVAGLVLLFRGRKRVVLLKASPPLGEVRKAGLLFLTPGMLAYIVLIAVLVALVTLG